MSDSQDFEKLISLISDLVGVDPSKLHEGSSLFHDFGVAGDDGAEVLQAIANEFEIDIGDVDGARYFGSEAPYNPFYHLQCFLQGKRLDHDIVRLEISDLVKTVKTRKWCEPGS
ncbi:MULTISPECIES: DUF1493 family protein [unclassified Ruegeria]|uniref:DUF1493 family protein n=1 Tax=unclassified Ruegeria TaxID=2625375 RepID=UPI001489B030|nr:MULTISPECIES: DUF1493 family protein [unclassified Ruegeria]NOD62535.1 DUF1493 family protein [Ruegeria sp. HKCCD6109]